MPTNVVPTFLAERNSQHCAKVFSIIAFPNKTIEIQNKSAGDFKLTQIASTVPWGTGTGHRQE